MQIGTTTLENSLSVPNGVELIYTLQPSNFTFRWYTLEKLLHVFIKDTYTVLFVAVLFMNSKKRLETTQIYTSRVDNWILVYSCNGLLYSSENGWTKVHTWTKDESQKLNGEGKKQVTEWSIHNDSIVIKLKTGKMKLCIHLW